MAGAVVPGFGLRLEENGNRFLLFLRRRGWYVDQQKPPPSLHCTVTAQHGRMIDAFLAALREATDEVRRAGRKAAQKAYGSLE
jgi:hypothetical protein